MKNSVLFLQGGGEGAHEADRPLAESLQGALGAEYLVHYPEMPSESYAGWRERVTKELAALKGPVVLAGHSLGASLLLKYVSEERLQSRVSGLFLIAPPFWGAEDWDVPEFALSDGFAAKLPTDLRVFFYHSRDDEVVPYEHLARYRALLPNATYREFEARGHQFESNLVEIAADVLLVK